MLEPVSAELGNICHLITIHNVIQIWFYSDTIYLYFVRSYFVLSTFCNTEIIKDTIVLLLFTTTETRKKFTDNQNNKYDKT